MKDEERRLWIERINSYRTSGLTAVKWAKDNNVSVHKLRSCIAKFNKEKGQISNNESRLDEWVSLIPSKLIDLSESIKPLKVTIGHATIEVTSGFDQDTLKSLIEILIQC